MESAQKEYSVYRTDEENWIKITISRIIEEELFDIVQKQLGENRKRSRIQRSGRRHLLQGLMVCQCCKYAYYAAKTLREEGATIVVLVQMQAVLAGLEYVATNQYAWRY